MLRLVAKLFAQLGAAAWWCGVWLWFSMLARVTGALQKVRRHG